MTALIIHTSDDNITLPEAGVTVIDTDDKILHIWKELPDDLPSNVLQALISSDEVFQVDSKGVEHQVTSVAAAGESGIMLCIPISILSVEDTHKLKQSLN